MKFDNKTF
jgi:F0F1-type ATP synthase delta subunit